MTTREEVHRHHWRVSSTHRVSEGFVVYRHCACGQWQVSSTPAEPLAEVAGRPALRVVGA